jgi:phage head maturation protease
MAYDEIGDPVPPGVMTMAGPSMGRTREYYDRSFPLDGIEILSRAKGGDGRTVEAYAAVFDTPQEIRDQHGHYKEDIARVAFNMTINSGAAMRALPLYHHGMNVVDSKPNPLAQVPLGSPKEIRVDGKGLLTITRYNKSPLAESVLEAIRNDDIRAQSFRGAIYKSNPMRIPRVRSGEPLPTVTRMELGLSDYGPTPRPYYEGASIVAVRAAQDIFSDIAGLDEDERAELFRMMLATTRGFEPEPGTATSHREAGTEEPRDTHSGRAKLLRLRAEAVLHGV